MRSLTELLMSADLAVAFKKADLEADEVEYLTGLPSFLVQTDEYLVTKNPVTEIVPVEPVEVPNPPPTLPEEN